MKTRDGTSAEILNRNKPGMSVFKAFGLLDGKPCHWTIDGAYRMDGKPDGRDLVMIQKERSDG